MQGPSWRLWAKEAFETPAGSLQDTEPGVDSSAPTEGPPGLELWTEARSRGTRLSRRPRQPFTLTPHTLQPGTRKHEGLRCPLGKGLGRLGARAPAQQGSGPQRGEKAKC